MEAPVVLGHFLDLPPDLLMCIVGRSLLTYIQLLSLSHGVRLRVRGTLRELSFDCDRELGHGSPKPTADALAALVGPCKSLAKLFFRPDDSSLEPTIFGCGRTEATCAGWVDEAFGGHDLLTVLEFFPTTSESAIELILLRLPGLLELRLGRDTQISTHLLATIARSCPHLQVLRSNSAISTNPLDVTALTPLSSSLRQFRCRYIPPSAHLDAFVSGLSAVGTVHIRRCRPAALEPLGAHLTRLSITDLGAKEEELPGPWLSRLEHLSLRDCPTFSVPLSRLLAANQATLQRLKLTINRPDAAGLAALWASLDAMPQLTHLELTYGELPQGAMTALPPALLGRLEHLTLTGSLASAPGSLCIASGRLKCLALWGAAAALSLDCPALVELRLPSLHTDQLTLKCPRLRLVESLPAWFMGFATPMPDLESASFLTDPIWLHDLLAGSPRLRSLQMRVSRPDVLAELCCPCACESLAVIYLELDVAELPKKPLVLRLPGRLETLWLSLSRHDAEDSDDDEWCPKAPLVDLHVEAPGLRFLDLDRSESELRMRLECPALTTLSLALGGGLYGPQITSLELDERTQLRSLALRDYCEPANLLGLLARHGVRLHHLALASAAAACAWPQLAAALGGLPRLTSLELGLGHAPSPLSLACPQLRTLNLKGMIERHKVVLACPLLEALSGLEAPDQLELALPARHLPPIQTCCTAADREVIEDEDFF
ncbi:hypothetical protein PAPYR_4918 [Paratrimastix pyriformis]|uniref:Uncharacterized protein n=1 Tax=Paratrimastix pyriformis TaxID=342808 RepID=A0ABQ8UQY3_9EUKA|nr:hypothetical protein PAPYR_4918 [Paratrimastix pyriformis]